MKRNIFNTVASRAPRRSLFDLSYEKKFTGDFGVLYPVLHDECIPGDIWNIANDVVIRFQPLVAPILHEINVYIHTFFIPYRILWDDWEAFITGGDDGTDTSVLPRWTPTDTTEGSLWDLFGFPTGVIPTGTVPLDFPRLAYNKVFNEWYRDETINAEITGESLKKRRWEKDYFTSALLWQQKGTAPALPITITGSSQAVWGAVTTPNQQTFYYNGTVFNPYDAGTKSALENNTVDLSSATATTFDVADLRLAFQIQRWLERNARAGSRYTEFLKSHFGVAPRDERLQRPEYVGGMKAPVIISEVLQTGETGTTPQGNLAGHGLSVNEGYIGKYRVKEFGMLLSLLSVMPKPLYQQGINRQWLRETRYDFYFPEFANLSEQAVLQGEIFTSTVASENETIFGYQGRYDELRTKQDMVCGEMRTTYDYWHMSRQFSVAPTLNNTFQTCVPRLDCFAAPSEPPMIISVGNRIRAARPIPIQAEPGLIDH